MPNSPLAPSRRTGTLALAAIGIVFGDIGTSPLYAMGTVFSPQNGLLPNRENLVGIESLILWSLVVVVSIKYVTLIMRANNHGEGGIMALTAMASSAVADKPKLRGALLMAGLFGAALFYGDGVITPAISVLSAVEGLKVAAPTLGPAVIPLSCAVLVALFLVQKRGTAGIGAVFGPVMVAWFCISAATGLVQIVRAPAILTALDPLTGLGFLRSHGWPAFVSLGAVVLALTGAEALYADMGHFGAGPIRLSWFGLVLPALALNYLGQGALLLAHPDAVDNPFFRLYPDWALYPMVFLATAATVIASQAVISGAFSMTKQAIQLGFLPRMNVVHTSDEEIGQIYVPAINWALMVAVFLAVLSFGSSTALGAAYGIAVTGTMLITTLLTFFVVRYAWHLNWPVCVLATGFFFAIDATFFSANLLKFAQGGWFPLLVGAVVFVLMSTWKRGREIVFQQSRSSASAAPLQAYLDGLFQGKPMRAPGTAAFFTTDPNAVPPAFASNLEHNAVVHERVLFITVQNKDVPFVARERCLLVTSIGPDCYRIQVDYGFKDRVDLPLSLEGCVAGDRPVDPRRISYFLSHASIVPTPGTGMWLWRERLFAVMSNNLGRVGAYFRLPANRVVELGAQIEI